MAKRERYIVEVEFKPGVRTNVYHGNNREEAVRLTNFWDERLNTFLTDHGPDRRTALERANDAFDEAIEKLAS